MINCFYWYSIIWSIVYILYIFGFSTYNAALNPALSCFIIISIFVSLILGYIFNKKIALKDECYKKVSNKKFYALIFGFIVDFIYSKQIPLLSILVLKNSSYGDFTGIPSIHPFLIGIGLYLSIRYSINIVYGKKETIKKDLPKLLILIAFNVLYYYRSMILFQLFAFANIWFYKYKVDKKLNAKKIIICFVLVLLSLFIYGGVGNIRDGYAFNDNSYIEKIGGYTYFPKVLPKQYMWTYSYVTSPLANLNFNIEYNVVKADKSIVNAILPDFISKRLFDDNSYKLLLIKNYFTASTGWCHIYLNGGFLAMYICYFYMVLMVTIGLFVRNKNDNYNSKLTYYIMSCIVTAFMFFYNTLTYVGIFIPFILSLICVFCEKRQKHKKTKGGLK